MIYFNKVSSLLADLKKVRTLIFPVLTTDVSFFTEYKLQGYKSVYFLIYFLLKNILRNIGNEFSI
jgi:hypothetical protein